MTTSSSRRSRSIAFSTGPVSPLPRSTGIWCACVRTKRRKGFFQSSDLAKKRHFRPERSIMYAWQSGSKYEIWLQATMTGPERGMLFVPSSRQRKTSFRNGTSDARATAYERLAPTLSADERRRLSLAMLADVITAARAYDRVWVLNSDAEAEAL